MTKYCPYCGASILENAAFCMECGESIPISTAQPQPAEPKKKHDAGRARKKADRTQPSRDPKPEQADTGYDGYYDDTPTADEGAFRERMDKGLIKRIVIIAAAAVAIIGLAIVMMNLL